MKSLLATAFVALSLTAIPTLALAQYMDINSIIAGIGDSHFLDDAGQVDSASGVRVVRLSSLAGAEQSSARLASVVDSKSSDINYLRSNLSINPIALNAIRNAGFSLEAIVSLDMSGDGAAVLYANDL